VQITNRNGVNGEHIGGRMGNAYVKCAGEAKDYGACISKNIQDITKGMCGAEMEKFLNCTKKHMKRK
jgi:hypothetical protein